MSRAALFVALSATNWCVDVEVSYIRFLSASNHVTRRSKERAIHSDDDRDLSTTNTNAFGRSLDVLNNDACELIHISVDGQARIVVRGAANKVCGTNLRSGSQWTPQASRYSAATPIEEITTCKQVCGLLCVRGGRRGEQLGARDFAVVSDWAYMMLSADEVCTTLGQPAIPLGLPLDGGWLADTWLRAAA